VGANILPHFYSVPVNLLDAVVNQQDIDPKMVEEQFVAILFIVSTETKSILCECKNTVTFLIVPRDFKKW